MTDFTHREPLVEPAGSLMMKVKNCVADGDDSAGPCYQTKIQISVWPSAILAIEIAKNNVGRDEEAQLNSGWILIGSELSSLNLNSSIRAE